MPNYINYGRNAEQKIGFRIFVRLDHIFALLKDIDQFEDRSCVGKTRLYANQLHFYMSSDKLSPCYRRISAFLAYINKFYRVYLISFDARIYAIIS